MSKADERMLWDRINRLEVEKIREQEKRRTAARRAEKLREALRSTILNGVSAAQVADVDAALAEIEGECPHGAAVTEACVFCQKRAKWSEGGSDAE